MDLRNLYYFNALPRVRKFFCCISLFTGCKIIGGFYMLLLLQALLGAAANKNYTDCYNNGFVYQMVLLTALILWCLTSCTTSLFLYGVVTDLPIYFILFMDVTVLLITFNLVMSFMMFFYFFEEDSCTWPYLFGGANFFGAVLLIYFLVIVNSHFHETVEFQGSTRAVFARRYAPQGAFPGAPPVSSIEEPSRAPSKPSSRAPSKPSSKAPSVTSSAAPSVSPPGAPYAEPHPAPPGASHASPNETPSAVTPTRPTSAAPRRHCNVI